MDRDYFKKGVEFYAIGIDPYPDKAFFQLETEEDRWIWHGWHWAKCTGIFEFNNRLLDDPKEVTRDE